MSSRHSTAAALHADAVAVLTAWEPPSPAQARLRERYLHHLAERPDGLQRTCHPDHLTASTLLLSADSTHALLTLHAKARQWFQLGGHCEDGDDTLAGAALREAREESGISEIRLDPVPLRLDEHAVPFCGAVPGVHHLDVWFVGWAPAGAESQVSEESLDMRWWPLAELPDGAEWDEAVAWVRARQST